MLLIGCLCAPSAEAADAPATQQVPEAFVKALVAGINAHDITAIRTITHPATLACMTSDKDDYYAWWLWEDGTKRHIIAPGYIVHADAPIDVAQAEMAMKVASFEQRHWPVQPDLALKIRYQSGRLSFVEKLFEITLHDGKAELVIDCPTALGLEQFHEKMVLVRAQKRKIGTLWKNTSAQDRTELAALLKQGKKIDFLDRAQKDYHLSQPDALALMDMVEYADTP